MGVPDSSLLDLIEKVKAWIKWGKSDRTSLVGGSDMDVESCKTCYECKMKFTDSCLKFHCLSCSRVFCRDCVVHIFGSSDVFSSGSGESKNTVRSVVDIKVCKFCSDLSNCHRSTRKFCDKVYPSESPRESPEPPSPNFSSDMFDGYSTHDASKSSFTAFSSHPSPVSLRHSPSRSDEDEGGDFTNQSVSPSSDCCHDTSDLESCSVSARHKFYHLRSFGSSPSNSPSRIRFTSNRVGHSVQDQQETPRSQNDGPFDQETLVVLGRLEKDNEDPETANDSNNLSVYRDQLEKQQKPLDFENNGPIWFPPPPDDEDDEAQNNFFTYDDEDDEIGETGTTFSSSGSLSSIFPAKDKQQLDHKEPLRSVVHGHFRALVLQLLQGEDIHSGKESAADDWIDIVTSLAWQAANYVKPDTSKGGSMDPVDYVKIKCIASGTRSDSTLIKGVVCTKNIKHKRMTSQYKNARLLILGGALEYQRAATQLASFDTLLQQEKEHLKMIVSRIEAHHPNVLLVEKSVSSYAQELLLEKEISLVLNVKVPLLERVARCTGALITPSIDNIATTRLGHCELFHLEKVSEEHEHANQLNKRTSKTLMFFDGCPRRLGCTVLLRGSCREELKKLKKVVQYAVFAAYHLSLETSFLADEGASLPKESAATSIAIPERTSADNAISVISHSAVPVRAQRVANDPNVQIGSNFTVEAVLPESLSEHHYPQYGDQSNLDDGGARDVLITADHANLSLFSAHDTKPVGSIEIEDQTIERSVETSGQEESQPIELGDLSKLERSDETKIPDEFYSAADSRQSILVSFSSRCVLNGTVCVRSRLLRIKFYGSFDKPLGRYLQDDLFGQISSCQSCKEPAEAHVICYTHQQANLTINVRRLPLVNSLPGERDKKIWMWHRCLKCAQIEGVPPATRRVIMSDAAWGLSFGKFLELSFSNHATANRVASCGHSLQRDCLRYYGCGSMVAFFRYTPIDILSVRLPPLTLEFSGYTEQEWLRKEAAELLCKAKALYAEISSAFRRVEEKSYPVECEPSDTTQLHDCIVELKELLMKEKNDYHDFLQLDEDETFDPRQGAIDILELNRLRHSLVIASHVWDRRLLSMKSFLQKSSGSVGSEDCGSCNELIDWRRDMFLKNDTLEHVYEESVPEFSDSEEYPEKALQSEQEGTGVSPYGSGELESSMLTSSESETMQEMQTEGENTFNQTSLERAPSAASVLSDQIDFAWSGTDCSPKKAQLLQGDRSEAAPLRQPSQLDLPPFRRLKLPARVHSFDSAMRLQDRIRKGLPPSSLHLSSIRSFHASGDYKNMIRDPVSSVQRTYSQMSPSEAHKFNLLMGSSPSFISYASLIPDGSRLMVPLNGSIDVVLAVYDNEPTSIISYALCSKVYSDWVTDKSSVSERSWNTSDTNKEAGVAFSLSTWQSFGSLDTDYMHYGSHGSEDASSTITSLFSDSKTSPHLRISFDDESSSSGGKVKFSVTCYFAKQFDALRRKCCPDELARHYCTLRFLGFGGFVEFLKIKKMEGGDVSVEGKVTRASWIKRPENAHLVVIGKSTGTCSSLEILSFNSESTSLSSSPKATYVLEEGGEPVRIAVHPTGDDFVCSTTTGCKLFELYGHEDNIKFVCKEFPLQDVGPQKCMAFSVDGSKLAIGGVDGHFRLFEWPTMRIIVDEPKAHKSFRDMDFSLDSEFLASTSTDGAARIWNTRDGVPVTLSRNTDENIELCRFSKDGTKPFLFTTVQKGNKSLIAVWDISTWKKIGHKSLYNKPASIMTISLDGKYLALGSKDGDVCVIDVTKMEISSLHKRLHLGTNITSLEFCPSERVALTTSSQWGVMVTKLNVPTDWKEWQIYLLLLGLFLASAVLFYVFFENSDSFWNFPDPSTRPKIETLHVDATSEEQWSSFGPLDL